jgi:hypothetical protein
VTLSLSLSLFHSALQPIVLSFALILMHGCTSHEPYTQAQVASAAGRQYVKIQVEAGRDKHIATQQATPMSWHVAPNNQSARRCSETRVSTGSDVDVAICARIAIQNDIDGILALGKSGFVVNGVSLKGILALGKSGFVVNGVSLKVGHAMPTSSSPTTRSKPARSTCNDPAD